MTQVSEGFPQDPLPSEDVSLLESEIKVAEHENGNADSEVDGNDVADPMTNPPRVSELQEGPNAARMEDGSALEEVEKGEAGKEEGTVGGGDGGKEEDTVRQMDSDDAATKEGEFSESGNVSDATYDEGGREGAGGPQSEDQPVRQSNASLYQLFKGWLG